MALKITIKSRKGIDLSYWRIDGKSPEINERQKFIVVALYGFVDKDHLVDSNGNDLEPVETRVLKLYSDDFIKVEDREAVKDSRDLLYKAIKAIKVMETQIKIEKNKDGKDVEVSKEVKVGGEFSESTKI